MSFNRLGKRSLAFIVALAFSTNVAGHYTPKVSINKSSKSLETELYGLNKDLSDKLNSDNTYVLPEITPFPDTTFHDRNFILDQYTNIPFRNRNKPVYGKLLFDKADNCFCYVYKQNGKSLEEAFLKVHEILEKNIEKPNPNEKHPMQKYIIQNDASLPIGAPSEPPEGGVHAVSSGVYFLLDLALCSRWGYFIHRVYRVNGYDVDASFNQEGNIVKIRKPLSNLEHK